MSGTLGQAFGPMGLGRPSPPWPRAGSMTDLVAGTQDVVAMRHHLPVKEADESVLRAGDSRRRRGEQHL